MYPQMGACLQVANVAVLVVQQSADGARANGERMAFYEVAR
jgi:hypothetical protein